MLVLSRSKGQQIVIGGSITVTILEVRGDKVKLGFAGPAEVPIHRQEVFERLQQERLVEANRTDLAICLAACPNG
ncbi:MAG TPA: carbon storage regulator [Pirellulales bacterium]|nr:carbon storage regulator [Pirellulales bacterium]